ncbi:hypothetical protein [Mesobacillus maritimus]|uniref:Lipoprotein n=1 Tax=Mesobacillus maritimus TaxID=1643336 RepID=A0ABS7K946_9BACI|nr:hypothetical protein [Mesobacillus maritimus]MBY0098784.1 hypothetical protein [Mesobacillus maritimus]
MKKVLLNTLATGVLLGCSSTDIEQYVEVKPNNQEIEEPKIRKEQYDVVWGTYDNEWVYSDEWTGEGFENFDEAMNVLDQCMTESEEETKSVYTIIYKITSQKKGNLKRVTREIKITQSSEVGYF